MSRLLLDRSPDLQRLRNEGFDLEVIEGHLVVRDVPYLDTSQNVARGVLVCPLTLAGDVTAQPNDHVMYFIGDTPHQRSGRPFKFINGSGAFALTSTLTATHMFSSKPDTGFPDYYEKVVSYAALLEHEARAVDPYATSRTFPVVREPAAQGVFEYADTASSRAGIAAISAKLSKASIAIVGLGGTGSYILDFIAKTPVQSIHLFDPDVFLQHNAFRAPGAASADELATPLHKVEYHVRTYSRMRRNIVAHPYAVDGSNIAELAGVDFVFLSLDTGPGKEQLVRGLEQAGAPFIDVGMGLIAVEGAVTGTLRTTASTPEFRDHVWKKNRIPFPQDDGPALYDQNIQVAELNALNAALAVIKWKKLMGFYVDLEHEHFSTYSIDGNHITNDDAS